MLVHVIEARQSPEEQGSWNNAVINLCEGDHYLLVLIDASKSVGGSGSSTGRLAGWLPTGHIQGTRPPGDWLRLILVALAVSAVVATVAFVRAALGK